MFSCTERLSDDMESGLVVSGSARLGSSVRLGVGATETGEARVSPFAGVKSGALSFVATPDAPGCTEFDDWGQSYRTYLHSRDEGLGYSGHSSISPRAEELFGYVYNVADDTVECYVTIGGERLLIAFSIGIFSSSVKPSYGDKFKLFYDSSSGYKVPVAEVVGQGFVEPPEDVADCLGFFERL